ncbi:hypothetical protein FHETE_6613 [Fusarium heterosporum]|uniref:C2H2-type domain-containing protein n=1 Tax=Fusarium heterosporum TaxID=42747 RepID=A0A8H5T6F5_FUSHE|nr:hypothetical protein FHETE_6613 [Fusarium heterosporum]
MFTHPTPTPDINIQSQPQDGFRNRPVANYWAVQGNLSALNTNVFPQYGQPSESPLPLSSSTYGHSSFDSALTTRPNFSTHPGISASNQWPCHGATSSQALIPSSGSEATEVVMRRLRSWVWFILRARLVLRNARQKSRRRHSASDCPSWTTGFNHNLSCLDPSFSLPCSDEIAFDSLANAEQVNLFDSIDLSSTMLLDNALGIMANDGNSQFLEQTDMPRQATVLSEEEVFPIPGPESDINPNGTTLPRSVSGQDQPDVHSSSQSAKRPIDCLDLDDSSVDETDEKPRDKKRSKKVSTSPRFACPFYSHDPERYETSRSCCGPGWETVHRVKEHIFRSHRLPEHQCRRCFKEFEGEEALSRHSRSAVACKVQARNSQLEGIDASQERLLHARAKKSNTGPDQKKIEEERWNEVYRIIFPNESQAPSPYYNRSQKFTVDEFGKNITAEFGKRIVARLSSMGMQPHLLNSVARVTRSVLLETVQSCQRGGEDIDSQNSQLTASQSPVSQPSSGFGQQLRGFNHELFAGLDNEQLLAQMILALAPMPRRGGSGDSGCFCHEPTVIYQQAKPIEIRNLPHLLKLLGFELVEPGSAENNHSDAEGKQLVQALDLCTFSNESKAVSSTVRRLSYSSSSKHSDYGSDDGDSAGSFHTSSSIDSGSSGSALADAEHRSSVILDRLMYGLVEWFELVLQQRGAQENKQASNLDSVSAIHIPGPSGQFLRSGQIPKRQRSDSDDENENNDDDGPNHHQKGWETSDAAEVRYVCPFFKHDRERYKTSQWKSCCWPGWASIHRVKQDLKSHTSLNEHQRADIICQRQSEGPEEEGVDEQQEKLLRARKRKNGKARQTSEEERWAEMYRILFPHDDTIPSPYPELCPVQPGREGEQLGANVLDSFENFARREFSRRMRPRMETLIDGILEQTLTSQAITDVANNVLQGIMESFRASQDQSEHQPEIQGSPPRSPSPGKMPSDSSWHALQHSGDFCNDGGVVPEFELDFAQILSCVDNGQPMDFIYPLTEVEVLDAFQSVGV